FKSRPVCIIVPIHSAFLANEKKAQMSSQREVIFERNKTIFYIFLGMPGGCAGKRSVEVQFCRRNYPHTRSIPSKNCHHKSSERFTASRIFSRSKSPSVRLLKILSPTSL